MTSARHPLLSRRDPDAPVAWRAGQPIPARQFLGDAAAQAEALEGRGPVVNLVRDRYRFAVGFAAALMAGQTSLFPPNALPVTLARLRDAFPTLVALADDATPVPQGVSRVVARAAAAAVRVTAAPTIDAALAAACLLTSGSTATPQPHLKQWGTLVANVAAAAERLAQLLERPTLAGLNIVATVPPQHSYGLESSVLLALLQGAAFDAGQPFYPADIAAALARVPRPRALVTTPFHLKTLLRAGVPLPPVDAVLCATAPLSPQLAARSEQAFGGRLIEIYGCTEAGQLASRRTAHTDLWTTFGALRVHAEGQGEDERFLVQGGHVQPATPLADVLQLHDDRQFRLLGRSNDFINVAGKRTSLSHLNYHLNSIDGVEDGAFWLPPDAVDGVVRPVAFVVAPRLGAAEVIAALRPRIDGIFVPKRVVHVAQLPREATGKLTEQALRTLAQAHLGT